MCQKNALPVEEYRGCWCDLWFDMGISEHSFELDSGCTLEEGVGCGSSSSRVMNNGF